MPSFKYSARDGQGRSVSGSLSAKSQADAVAELRKRNLIVLDVREGFMSARGVKGGGFLASLTKARAGVRTDELVLFTRQLSTMISAGVPLLESLEVLMEQAESAGFRVVLDTVIESVRSGTDLSTALERYPRIFKQIYVSMVRAGEVSGQLDDILVRLAEYLESSQKLKREVKAAMTYPVISLILVVGITMFLMVGIVPKFQEIFESLDVELPGLTQKVLLVSDALKNNIVLMAASCVAFFVLLAGWKRTKGGRRAFDWFVLYLPVFGPLFQKVALSRFSRTFSTLIKSGVPILGALEIVAETAGNTVIAEVVNNAQESVRQGNTLAEPLMEAKIIPPMVSRMIQIGERSGSLEQLLEKIADFYDDQVSAAVKTLTSMIEPIMIAIMGFMVGGIVLAVFLPIFELQKALGRSG
ncbi:MAG: type II secretion system F family protein [Planctomycetota bacterium]|nr:type II secretion system F family protein [Planctomycetota bacterium]